MSENKTPLDGVAGEGVSGGGVVGVDAAEDVSSAKGPLWLPPEQRDAIAAAIGGAPDVHDRSDSGFDASAEDNVVDTHSPDVDVYDAAEVEETADVTVEVTAVSLAGGAVEDGSGYGDDPLRDTLLQLGYLTEEQVARVRAHGASRDLEFDQAALELGYITPDDLDRAREVFITSLAQRNIARRPISDEVVVVSDPRGVRAEAIRLLRTQVIAQHIKAGRRGLAVVSPVPGVGCSNLVANLAAALSQVGIKTLLVDANLRDPRQHELFGLDRDAPGLSSYLTMQVNRPERVVQANILPSLAVITAGPAVSRPQELLSARRFRDGVNMLLREYDLVLFDTPPANTSADVLTIGSAASYVIMVARRDQSFFKDVSTLVEQLQSSRCQLIGSVLNEF